MRNRIYDLETLRKAYNRGDHLKYLFFWGHTPPADGRINESCFSQWWMCRFAVDGTEYTCVGLFEEHKMANPGGGESERPDLGYRYGKK